jgi:hypothetical protein
MNMMKCLVLRPQNHVPQLSILSKSYLRTIFNGEGPKIKKGLSKNGNHLVSKTHTMEPLFQSTKNLAHPILDNKFGQAFTKHISAFGLQVMDLNPPGPFVRIIHSILRDYMFRKKCYHLVNKI